MADRLKESWARSSHGSGSGQQARVDVRYQMFKFKSVMSVWRNMLQHSGLSPAYAVPLQLCNRFVPSASPSVARSVKTAARRSLRSLHLRHRSVTESPMSQRYISHRCSFSIS